MLRHGVSGKRDWCEESGCDDGAPSFGAYRMAARDGYGARHNGDPSRRARGAARNVRRIACGKPGSRSVARTTRRTTAATRRSGGMTKIVC
ncbi:hypothetical protein C6T53_18435 [Burkholderia multivorans]|nr:hypothetical protein C6T53_18435 [Burkholderia multivorans]